MDANTPNDILPPGAHSDAVARIHAAPEHHSGAVVFPGRIRTATAADMRFIVHLQRKFSNQLGFLPTAALIDYVDQKRVGLVLENNEPAGYILGRDSYRYQRLMRPITQAAVAMDAQRRSLGLALVKRVEARAIAAGQQALQAVCRADLEANEFWAAAGFEPIHELTPDNARGQPLTVWRRLIVKHRPDWFYIAPPRTGTRNQRP